MQDDFPPRHHFERPPYPPHHFDYPQGDFPGGESLACFVAKLMTNVDNHIFEVLSYSHKCSGKVNDKIW